MGLRKRRKIFLLENHLITCKKRHKNANNLAEFIFSRTATTLDVIQAF